MIAKNYIELPTEGLVRGCLLDEGNAVTVYLDIKTEKRFVVSHQDYSEESDHYEPVLGKEEDVKVKVGFAVRCEKPVSRSSLINAAEAQVYGLKDASATASFNASLARKFRENPDDQEVKEHDSFIDWVKTELTKVGIR